MSYKLGYFQELRAANPTWTALRSYLTSSAGGDLQVRETEGSPFAIIHYRKGISSMSIPHVRWFRSVVWNKESNMPVSVSTPKAVCEDDTGGAVLEWGVADFEGKVVREYLEGVTMNLFRGAEGAVEVSTRTRMGAGAGFYNKTTFRQMLEDAVLASGAAGIEEFFAAHIQEGETFLTVLVQHPEHRVVEKVAAARVFVLQAGAIEADGTVMIREGCADGPAVIDAPAAGQSPATWFEDLVNGRTWVWQGVVVQDGEGRRWRVRSAVYRMIRSLRGSTARPDERFFSLRAAGLVKTYLQYYPEESKAFWTYEKWIRSATQTLYNYYVEIYKARQLSLTDVDARWHTHLGALHHMFMGQLKPVRNGLHMSHVVAYMNALPVPRLLFLMNLDKRNMQRSARVAPAVI